MSSQPSPSQQTQFTGCSEDLLKEFIELLAEVLNASCHKLGNDNQVITKQEVAKFLEVEMFCADIHMSPTKMYHC